LKNKSFSISYGGGKDLESLSGVKWI